MEDLKIIRELIPENKKILFQVHFRPNIIYNNNTTIKKEKLFIMLLKIFVRKIEILLFMIQVYYYNQIINYLTEIHILLH